MKRLVITLLLALLGVGGVALVKYHAVLFPSADTSEVYRHYRDFPGVDAAYIRQMPINDTLRVDMTLLQARDSLAFANLLRDMGRSEENIKDMATLKAMYEKRGERNIRFSARRHRGNLNEPCDPDPANNEVFSIFPVRLIVAVFHTHNEMELNTIYYKSLYNKLDIDNHK
ncbi:MAG: hypothetical protein K6E96_05730 [Bacteroidales bacterium]|nr:hypothetical protein [Bacteroidales bacterium]